MKECFSSENFERSTESSGAVIRSKSCPNSVWNVTWISQRTKADDLPHGRLEGDRRSMIPFENVFWEGNRWSLLEWTSRWLRSFRRLAAGYSQSIVRVLTQRNQQRCPLLVMELSMISSATRKKACNWNNQSDMYVVQTNSTVQPRILIFMYTSSSNGLPTRIW